MGGYFQEQGGQGNRKRKKGRESRKSKVGRESGKRTKQWLTIHKKKSGTIETQNML